MSEIKTEAEVAFIESQAAKATAGPWIDHGLMLGEGSSGKRFMLAQFDHYPGNYYDVQFAAAARTNVPALCAALREAWAARDEAVRIAKENAKARAREAEGTRAARSCFADCEAALAACEERETALEAERDALKARVAELEG